MSPMTVKVRRKLVPTSPVKTCPLLIPARRWNFCGASRIRHMARNMRPSSSCWLAGTPAARITLPPLASMSVARKLTPSSSTDDCTTDRK